MPKPPSRPPGPTTSPRWHQDVVAKAELADNGPVRGTQVIRPYGYAIWERMQAEVDDRIKATGAPRTRPSRCSSPRATLQREAEHVEGFSPSYAVVTIAGGKELEEPVVVRPTSETIFGEYMAKWVQSYRDLPLLLNQWCNIVRWELRPRLLPAHHRVPLAGGPHRPRHRRGRRGLRPRILHDVYRDFMVEVLAMPVSHRAEDEGERFAGGINTLTCEAVMADGKALQMGTSHELGQNFARAFEIDFLDADGNQQLAWTTSWGVSTRMIGGLIMAHGDDDGLRLRPAVAPIQAVVLLVRDEDGAGSRRLITESLRTAGVKVQLDDRTDNELRPPGTDWELKGVPPAGGGGPRDLANEQVTLVRRDSGTKTQGPAGRPVPGRSPTPSSRPRPTSSASATEERDARTVDVAPSRRPARPARAGSPACPGRLVGDAGEEEPPRRPSPCAASSARTARCPRRGRGRPRRPGGPAATERSGCRTPGRYTCLLARVVSEAWAWPTPFVSQRSPAPRRGGEQGRRTDRVARRRAGGRRPRHRARRRGADRRDPAGHRRPGGGRPRRHRRGRPGPSPACSTSTIRCPVATPSRSAARPGAPPAHAPSTSCGAVGSR